MRDVVSPGNRHGAFSGRKAKADIRDNVLAELGFPIGVSDVLFENSGSMKCVPLSRHVLKIACGVVVWIAINMVHLPSCWASSDKGIGHDLVNHSLCLEWGVIKEHLQIRPPNLLLQNEPTLRAACLLDSLDSSQRRDFIDALESDYRLPDFRGIVALRHDSILLKSGRVQSRNGATTPPGSLLYTTSASNINREIYSCQKTLAA